MLKHKVDAVLIISDAKCYFLVVFVVLIRELLGTGIG